MIVTIHQPEHLSYLGFWDKISSAETLVLLDCVHYEKNYFQNRNLIYGSNGKEYITIPVSSEVCDIKDKKVSSEWITRGRRKLLGSIKNSYSKHKFFEDLFPELEKVYNKNYTYLIDYNVDLLYLMMEKLSIETMVVFASELNVKGRSGELLSNICKSIGASKYISGKSGKDYLDESLFDIPIEYQAFQHPTYEQKGSIGFIPYLSVIDAYMNVGAEIMTIIKKQ